MDEKDSINLALVVGYCLSSLQEIAEQLSKGDANKATTKTYDAIKFIKDKTEKQQATQSATEGMKPNE